MKVPLIWRFAVSLPSCLRDVVLSCQTPTIWLAKSWAAAISAANNKARNTNTLISLVIFLSRLVVGRLSFLSIHDAVEVPLVGRSQLLIQRCLCLRRVVGTAGL